MSFSITQHCRSPPYQYRDWLLHKLLIWCNRCGNNVVAQIWPLFSTILRSSLWAWGANTIEFVQQSCHSIKFFWCYDQAIWAYCQIVMPICGLWRFYYMLIKIKDFTLCRWERAVAHVTRDFSSSSIFLMLHWCCYNIDEKIVAQFLLQSINNTLISFVFATLYATSGKWRWYLVYIYIGDSYTIFWFVWLSRKKFFLIFIC